MDEMTMKTTLVRFFKQLAALVLGLGFAFQALASYVILAVLAGLVGRGRRALDSPPAS